MKFDVVVVGGGTAGVPAAVAAARNGVRVALVEQNGFVGGMAGMGLPFIAFHDRNKQLVVRGIALELITRLQKMDAASSFAFDPIFHSIIGVSPTWLRYVCLELLEKAGVEVFLNSMFARPVMRGESITGVEILSKSGLEKIEARVTVDCTGDGDVAAAAGAPFTFGSEKENLAQAATLLSRVSNVDFEALINFLQVQGAETRELLRDHPDLLRAYLKSLNTVPVFVVGGLCSLVKTGIEKGELAPFTSWIVMVVQRWAGFITLATSRVAQVDATKRESLDEAIIEAMKQTKQIFAFLRSRVPGFEHAELVDIAPRLGVRESRHITGDSILLESNVHDGTIPSDSVALGSHPIDIWDATDTRPHVQSSMKYGIPYACLLPRGVENLLVAGRCISATHAAAASARIMPTCMATGQAAGTAAALSVIRNCSPRALSVRALQEKLVRDGAEIGVDLPG